VLAFFKDVLGSSFRPFSDLVACELWRHKVDLLQFEQEGEGEEEEEEKEPE